MPDNHGPYRNMRFMLELDGIVRAGFRNCRIPEARTDVIEYREGTDPPTPRNLAGLNRYGRLVLETGLTDSMAIAEWHELVREGKVDDARRVAAVVLLDQEGQIGARWELARAWPVTYRAPDLDAMGEAVAIETVEIVCEEFGRRPPGGNDGSDTDDSEAEEVSDGGTAEQFQPSRQITATPEKTTDVGSGAN